MSIGWVFTIAFIIWFCVSLAGMINSGGFNANTQEPFLFAQSAGFGLAFVCSGIFLLFHYPYAGYVLFAMATFVVIRGYLDLKKSKRKMEQ
ncbi:hypothetical protein JND74_003544 [Salmonella enterica]|nr:hypothetical protein [Salmonella enterica]EHE3168815.1 hypothetical protein [Salmonella enterica]EHM5264024.1 hypothetical protein [Salmonella enterica]EIR0277959.1 hypothetical protein [Salmonella enterica]